MIRYTSYQYKVPDPAIFRSLIRLPPSPASWQWSWPQASASLYPVQIFKIIPYKMAQQKQGFMYQMCSSAGFNQQSINNID